MLVAGCWLLVAGCWLQVASCQLSVVSCQLSVVGCRLPVVGCRLSVAGCRLPVAGCRLSVAGCRLPVAGCRLPVVGCRLSVAGCRLSVVGCRLLVASCQLQVASCKLSVVSCGCGCQWLVAGCQLRLLVADCCFFGGRGCFCDGLRGRRNWEGVWDGWADGTWSPNSLGPFARTIRSDHLPGTFAGAVSRGRRRGRMRLARGCTPLTSHRRSSSVSSSTALRPCANCNDSPATDGGT